jgi:hypothetical protein
MAQFLRPIADQTNNWASGGWADLDESSASDSDFMYSNDNPNDDVNLEFTNTGIGDPLSSTGHIVRWRKVLIDGGVVATSAGSGCDLDVELWQGVPDVGTLIVAMRTNDVLDADLSWTADSYTLSAAEADNITDYNDLYIHFHARGGGGPAENRRGAGISWLEMEIPDEGTPTRNRIILTI